jgi:hypothetical protein
MRKRPLSLIEIIVCIGLLSLLLSTLFYWYHSFTKQKAEFNHLKGPLMEERYAHQRLQHILPTAELPFFTTNNNSLVFIFDRGPSDHPLLSGKILGRLSFDPNLQCLSLGIWPKPDKENPHKSPSQSWILLDGITTCTFEFYNPPDPFQKVVDPKEVGKLHPRVGWQNEWRADYRKLPALVKLCITRPRDKELKEHTIEYLFDLHSLIIYPQESA